jgi:hypothetical protein
LSLTRFYQSGESGFFSTSGRVETTAVPEPDMLWATIPQSLKDPSMEEFR